MLEPGAPRRLLALAGLVVLSACAAPLAPPRLVLESAAFADLSGWQADDVAAALPALLKSCRRIAKLPRDAGLDGAGLMGRADDWAAPCAQAERIPNGDPAAARRFFEAAFRPYRARNGDEGRGFVTGYYEAELRGARRPDARYRYPIYRKPGDPALLRFERAEIENGALRGRGLELLWVDDAADAFFLHVQGSGRVAMKEGGVVRLGFAAKNGHAYTAIGRELAARGAMPLEAVTMRAIRDWIAAHPEEGRELMRRNRSYVFFRELSGFRDDEGPLGAEGVPLTPGRSVAVDPAYLPFGAPLWLATRDPRDPARALSRLVVAQDSGTAIKGPLRVDLFFGAGKDAAAAAGTMKHPGELFVLRPRHLPTP